MEIIQPKKPCTRPVRALTTALLKILLVSLFLVKFLKGLDLLMLKT